jgi:hypothetical protein
MSMTWGGWVFLVATWGAMLILISYCMAKVLRKK